MILAIAIQTLNNRRKRSAGPYDPAGKDRVCRSHSCSLSCCRGYSASGTVTLLLKPVIVTLHLLGGMALVALLAWLSARQSASDGVASLPLCAAFVRWRQSHWWCSACRSHWVVGSARNYAAAGLRGFSDLPRKLETGHRFCSWIPFFCAEVGHMTAEGEPLSNDALNAIHWAHRVGCPGDLPHCGVCPPIAAIAPAGIAQIEQGAAGAFIRAK